MREDAWVASGKPHALPREWFKDLYLWDVKTAEVVRECPPDREARPDRPPSSGDNLLSMLQRRAKESAGHQQ